MYLFLLFLCVKHWLKQRVPNTFFTVKMWKLRHWHFPEMPTAGVVEMDAVCFYLFIFSLQNTHQDESPPPSLILLIRQDRRSRVTATFPCVHLSFPQLLCEHLRWEGKKKATQHHSLQTSVLPEFALPQCSHGAFNCLKILPENNAFLWQKEFFWNCCLEREHWTVSNYSNTLLNVQYNHISTWKKKTYWNMQHTVQYWNHIQVQ